MESFEWVIWVLAAVFGIGSAISNNNKKKREEQASSSAGGRAGSEVRGAGNAAGSAGPARSGRKSLAEVLEELARQAAEESSPTAPRRSLMPAAPESTSHDYYSLEGEYDAMDGRGYDADRGGYSAEVSDAERRYVGGEFGSSGGELYGAESSENEMQVAFQTTDSADDITPATLSELLGGDFDLRRAVIEAEILTPKYIARS